MSAKKRAVHAASPAHTVEREMILRLNVGLFPTLDALRAVLEECDERASFIDPADLEEERRSWRNEAEEAAEEAKDALDAEISRHAGTREDLRNAEKDLSDLTKKYEQQELLLDDARKERNRLFHALNAEQEKNEAALVYGGGGTNRMGAP